MNTQKTNYNKSKKLINRIKSIYADTFKRDYEILLNENGNIDILTNDFGCIDLEKLIPILKRTKRIYFISIDHFKPQKMRLHIEMIEVNR